MDPVFHIKRICEGRSTADGYRVLVDYLWPRGIKKEAAQVDEWVKDPAPSAGLRKWYGHDPARWPEFSEKYLAALKANTAAAAFINAHHQQQTTTFICRKRGGAVQRCRVAAIPQGVGRKEIKKGKSHKQIDGAENRLYENFLHPVSERKGAVSYVLQT